MSQPEPAYDTPPFMPEFDGVPRGVLEARCYRAEVAIRNARAAIEAGDTGTALMLLRGTGGSHA